MNASERPSVLVGLIGSGIGSSLTPSLHEREGDEQRMRYLYRIIDLDAQRLGVADLPDLLLAAERTGFTGLNITHPCKQAVVGLLDELSGFAEKAGAVNTVVFSGGRRIGHNTDAWGFFESFRQEIAATCRYDRVLLLGVGGAGTAIAHALLGRTECALEIFDTDRARAQAFSDHLEAIYGQGRSVYSQSIADSLGRSDGIINATPVGMRHHPGCPMDTQLLRPDLWVADIVYVPMETELVTAATQAGCTVMRGGGMAVYQAVGAFELFTGVTPNVPRMQAHFESLLHEAESVRHTSRSGAHYPA